MKIGHGSWRRLIPLVWTLSIAGAVAGLPGAPAPRPVSSPPVLPTFPPRLRWIEARVDPRPFDPDAHAEQGERLYGWNCLPCHGPDGKGDGPVAQRLGLRPRDFTRGLFELKTSSADEMPFDADLYRSITTGFPGGAMPSFADFTVEERWSLVDFVRSLAWRPAPDGSPIRWFEAYPARTVPGSTPDFSTGRLARGAHLFEDLAGCSRCHGPRGRGDGPLAALLLDEEGRPEALPDFARAGLSFKAGDHPEDVYRVLATGMAGTAMPSFGSLSPADRRDLALFVTSLAQPVSPGEELFLRRGCTQCHSIGRGRRVGPDLAGVALRRDRGWIRRWLEDPTAMLAADPEARALARDYPVPMPDLRLSPAEVSLLVGYLAPPAGRRGSEAPRFPR